MMPMQKKLSVTHLQWITWILLFTIQTLSLLAYDTFSQALVYSLINIGSYIAIIYGNASLLLPAFYEKNRKLLYVFLAVILILLVTAARYSANFYIYNRFFADKPMVFKWTTTASSLASSLLVFLSSILFYITLHFFRLKRKQEQLQKKHAEAELNLLKAQVQPHFLFNTLNNIYFVAQRESPATALLLEQLSLIMRYFVDEAPKDRIALLSELKFIKSYIELEKMRMRYPITVTIKEEGVTEDVRVPPMLLVPLVENVFKHGVDKRRSDNYIYIWIVVENSRLQVLVENRLSNGAPTGKSEVGLKNLDHRLALLFGNDYLLQGGEYADLFKARLNIPL